MMTAMLFALSIAWLTIAPPAPHPARQPSTVVITVADAGTQRPLTNADVTDLVSGQHRFTNERGQARLDWPADGRLKLRVRELGYKPVVRTIQRDDTSPELTSFALSRVAYVISAVESKGRCIIDADSSSRLLSVAALEQLRQGAQKYTEFRNAYPFGATVERRTAKVPAEGQVKTVTSAKQFYKSDDLEQEYHPGQVVRRGRGMNIPILFLSTLADSTFWENHCYIVRRIEWYEGTRVLRLEFSPNSAVTGPDWEGSALLDSASSYLLRVNFSIANLGSNDTPRRFDGYSTFSSPSPFVIMPDSSYAEWWLRKRGDNDDWGPPDIIQALYIGDLVYRKGKPPGYPGAIDSIPPRAPPAASSTPPAEIHK
jgi:hypothetical protein